MEVLIGLLVILLSAVLLYVKRSYNYWKNLGIQQFPVQFPYGNGKGMNKEYHMSDFLLKFYEKTKAVGEKFSGVYLALQPIFLVCDLDLVKSVLVKDFNVFVNRGQYFNEKDDPLSAHIFNLEDDPWRNLRQKLSPTFTSGKMKMMFGTMYSEAEKLLKVIDKQMERTGQLEVKDTLARFTTNVICSAAFGIECNTFDENDRKFYDMGTKLFSVKMPFFKRVLMTSFKELSRKLHFTVTPPDVADFYMGITKQTVEYREKNPTVNRQDFMNLLVQMKQSNSLTMDQIAAQSFVFFLAGFETSSSTMTNAMFELSVNEDIQEKARQSVKAVIEKHGSITYEAVQEMHYLEQCVKETLRKYPVVPVLVRSPSTEYKIPNTDVVIPKGSNVWIPVYAIHYDPEIYPDPEKFNPDRFSPEEVEKRHPYAHIPFGEGPRMCIGMRFGMVESKLGLAKILMNYKFSIDRTKTSVPFKKLPHSFVIASSERIFVNIEKVEV